MKDNHLTMDELFDCSYSGNRYVKSTDIFVPVRKIWEIFINLCRSNYNPGPYVMNSYCVSEVDTLFECTLLTNLIHMDLKL